MCREMQNRVDKVAGLYIEKYGTAEGIDIAVKVTSDLRKLCMELAPSEKWREYVSKDEDLDSANGTVILGDKVNDKIYVAISEKAFSYNNRTWIGTVCHEMTHAYDQYNFCKIKGIEHFTDFLSDKDYSNFIMWSEFHARKLGFKAIREAVTFENPESGVGVGTFQEIDEWSDWIKKSYREEFQGFYTYSDIYQLMQHLGRLAALRERHIELHRTYFADMYKNMIFNTFGEIVPAKRLQVVYELYCLMFDCSDVTMIYERLPEMRKIIKRLLPGLPFFRPGN